MNKSFNLRYIKLTKKDLEKIGFDKSYIHKGIEKHKFNSIKIQNLTCAQANIIKQTALSLGTDCAVHREVITGRIEYSDCILSGSINQLKKIAQKLELQPFNLKQLSTELIDLLDTNIEKINIRTKVINWEKTIIMGILNITPDSFSDGGKYNTLEKSLEHYRELVINGADIIDIGGESTRPYAQTISPEEEQQRILPIIQEIRKFDTNTLISVDTRNSQTAKLAIEAGADIINDVSATEWDSNMINIAIEKNCPIILNHSQGTPITMQNNPEYKDVVEDIYNYFLEKTKILINKGINPQNIIIDPGIGFGKTTEQNIEIIKRIEEFKSLKFPILVGHSRKSFIKETINSTNIDDLDYATAQISQDLITKGVNILRVHNVKIYNLMNKIINSLI